MINKIIALSKARIDFFENTGLESWYKGSETYFEQIIGEIAEAKEEDKPNNEVYLEYELGDVLWDYLCILHGLKSEGKINSIESVFERCFKKMSGRINSDGTTIGIWNETKALQNEEFKREHEEKYNI